MVRIISVGSASGDAAAGPAGAPEAAFCKPVTGRRYLSAATTLALLASDRLQEPVLPPNLAADRVGLCVAGFGGHFEYAMELALELAGAEKPMISPMLGPNNTPNAVAGQLAIYHGTTGFAQSFCDSATAGMEALAYGASAISSGRAQRVLVVGAESQPQERERLSRVRDPELLGGGVAVLLAGEPDEGSPGPCLAGCGRAFAASCSDGGYAGAIAACVARAVSGSDACGVVVDTVLLGLPERDRSLELEAVAHGLKQVAGFRYLPAEPRIAGRGSSLATMFQLERALRLLGGPQDPELPCFGSTPGAGGRRGILINDVGGDGSVGSTLIVAGGRHGLA